ncbi:MAG: hypothetical protein ACREJO_11870 [Phycisphaerales bacterium]
MNKLAISTVLLLAVGGTAQAQFFASGPADPVVLRIGSGATTASGVAAPVQAQHYLNGVASQAVPASITDFASGASGVDRLTLTTSATSEGLLTNSMDMGYVVLAGYNAAGGTAAVAGATANADRMSGFAPVGSTGLTSISGVTSLIGTQATAYAASSVRSATSRSGVGSDTWSGGTGTGSTGGVRYANTNTLTSATVTNMRAVDIYASNLYASASSGSFLGVNAYQGGGLPTTSGNTIINLINTGAGSSAYEFAFTNTGNSLVGGANVLDPVSGYRICYVADDRASASGGIQRWEYTGSAWTLQYTLQLGAVGQSLGARGLAGYFDGTNNVLYATNASGTGLYQITDTGAAASATQLASAGANNVFRGVALAVPTPGAAALMGIGGLLVSRRRRA